MTYGARSVETSTVKADPVQAKSLENSQSTCSQPQIHTQTEAPAGQGTTLGTPLTRLAPTNADPANVTKID
jgi:hypothetical protein